MLDLRPVGYLVGMIVAALGLSMLIPAGIAWSFGDGGAAEFVQSAFISTVTGGAIAISTIGASNQRLNIQQIFLITTLVWLILPVFGAIPFYIMPDDKSYTDAFFEAMSGLTTTGATIYTDLDTQPRAVIFWRAMLQWFGGIGIIVVAMALLPALRVGGMQIFRTEAFDTMGKVLPRAAEISVNISTIYVGLTVACMIGYNAAGVGLFDATTHAMTTVATGGFSSRDASFAAMPGAPEYVATIFMILASLPFVRYVQLMAGTARPILFDPQIRAFIGLIVILVVTIALYRVARNGELAEPAFRQSLFNITSILSGTGYASADYQAWGPFAVVLFFLIGLIGGCAGSTCCSVKIFRFQILFSAIRAQVGLLHSPHGVFIPRYDGRTVDEEIFSSVMAFFVMFLASLIIVAVLLGLMGLDLVTALSGSAAALANIGPGLGETIGPTGTFEPLPDAAKWVLAFAMLIGRLELLSVFVLFTAAFWRR